MAHGVAINAIDYEQRTALHLACEADLEAPAMLLARCGASISMKDEVNSILLPKAIV
jgi:hypothetical protein